MKLLFVTTDLASGGAQRVVSLLANHFAKSDEVFVLTVQGDKVKYELDDRVNYVPIVVKHTNKILRVYERIQQIRKAFNSIEPNVIVSFETENNIYSLFCNAGNKRKIIVSERNDPYNDPPSNVTKVIRNIIYNIADGFVFQTPDARSYFNKKIQHKGIIIPNPVNEKFETEDLVVERNKVIVNVCRLSKQKNLKLFLDILLNVCNKFPDYSGIIYGEGPEKESLKEYAESIGLKDKVIFAGFCDDVKSAIYNSKLFLCTSDYEGISNSILEAMMLGLPVVATDCPIGGTRMAIKNGYNGLLFPTGDVKTGTDLVSEIILNPDFANKLGNNARLIKNLWSIDRIVGDWRDYIEEIYSR